MNRHPHLVRAFSLVEILVVVAIIAVLAAVATPAVNGVMANGRSAQCVGNLRGIGAAALAYAEDHGGRLPPISEKYNWNAANAHRWWMSFLYNYGTANTNAVDVKKIWRCPEVTNDEFRTQGAIVYSSYTAFRPVLNYVNPPDNPNGSQKLLQIRKPSAIWMFGDGGKPVGSADGEEPPEKYMTAAAMSRSRTQWDPSQGRPAFRHRRSAHYVACDGHVESLNWETAKDLNCGPFGTVDSGAGQGGKVVY